MNLSDLTEVLRDHADLDGTAHDVRMAGIRARVVASRRRRALTGVVCLVLVLVGAVYLALPREIAPAQPTRSLPEYRSGAKLVEQAWADLPTSSVTLEYTPVTDVFLLFEHCVTDPAGNDLATMFVINGKAGPGGGCGGDSTTRIDLARYGVVGEPFLITMFVGFSDSAGELPEKVSDLRPPDATMTGEFAVGVGELVPLDEYSFPPRPEKLTAVDELVSSDFGLRADENDPDARQTVSVEWRGPLVLNASVNTPGRLEVLVNDESVYALDSWTYHGTSGMTILGEAGGPHIPVGETVTITVYPERTTGDWIVQFSEKE